jgi:hypothetical protein
MNKMLMLQKQICGAIKKKKSKILLPPARLTPIILAIQKAELRRIEV